MRLYGERRVDRQHLEQIRQLRTELGQHSLPQHVRVLSDILGQRLSRGGQHGRPAAVGAHPQLGVVGLVGDGELGPGGGDQLGHGTGGARPAPVVRLEGAL